MVRTRLGFLPPKHNYYFLYLLCIFPQKVYICSFFFNKYLTEILPSPVKTELDLRYVQRFSSYLTENIALQRTQSANAVEENDSCILCKLHRIHKHVCGLRAPVGASTYSNH
jgi:hypothetical protein